MARELAPGEWARARANELDAGEWSRLGDAVVLACARVDSAGQALRSARYEVAALRAEVDGARAVVRSVAATRGYVAVPARGAGSWRHPEWVTALQEQRGVEDRLSVALCGLDVFRDEVREAQRAYRYEVDRAVVVRALGAARRDVAAAVGLQWVVAACLARAGQRCAGEDGAARGGRQLALAWRVLGWSEVWARGRGAATDARTALAEVRWLDGEEIARRAQR